MTAAGGVRPARALRTSWRLFAAFPRKVYASVKVGSHYEIARYSTKDGGKSWKRQWLTRNSSTDNVRPVVPRGHPKDAQDLLWMRGDYIFYTKFRTSIVGITSGR